MCVCFSFSLSYQRKLDCPCDWAWGLLASLWSDLLGSVRGHAGDTWVQGPSGIYIPG